MFQQFFVPIARFDPETRTVEAYCYTSGKVKSDKWNLTRAALEKATPIYMEMPCIRAMHRNDVAAGHGVSVVWDDKGCRLTAKITDDNEWNKVVEGTYRGFSLGGAAKVARGNDIEVFDWTETSLVDRPADPGARFSVARVAGISDEQIEAAPLVELSENADDAAVAAAEAQLHPLTSEDVPVRENLERYSPRQPRDEDGKWTEAGTNHISVGHALHVANAEGIDEEHHAGIKEGIESGRLDTREKVLDHIDAIHEANRQSVGRAPKREGSLEDRVRHLAGVHNLELPESHWTGAFKGLEHDVLLSSARKNPEVANNLEHIGQLASLAAKADGTHKINLKHITDAIEMGGVKGGFPAHAAEARAKEQASNERRAKIGWAPTTTYAADRVRAIEAAHNGNVRRNEDGESDVARIALSFVDDLLERTQTEFSSSLERVNQEIQRLESERDEATANVTRLESENTQLKNIPLDRARPVPFPSHAVERSFSANDALSGRGMTQAEAKENIEVLTRAAEQTPPNSYERTVAINRVILAQQQLAQIPA